MQINRLFEIVYLLMARGRMTATELAAHFEVSTRTIYRDVESLCMAGIPIYTSKGKNGGIHLLEDFVLKKALLSEGEQNEVLAGVQGLSAIDGVESKSIMTKLAGMFGKNREPWIDVDFSRWNRNDDEKGMFISIKNAILQNRMITFQYFGSKGEKTFRTVEPVRLIFKGQSWYLYGFCMERKDFRFFKISRAKDLVLTETVFQKRHCEKEQMVLENSSNHPELVMMKLRVNQVFAFRVYDEFKEEHISKDVNGDFLIDVLLPKDEWCFGYLLSFGTGAEVLEPKEIREKMILRLQMMLNNYGVTFS